MPAWFTAVFPVVTLLLGAGAAFAREAFMQSRQDRREALARQHERQAAAVDRREEFELQHLVEMHRLLRQWAVTMLVLTRASVAHGAAQDADSQEQLRAARESFEAKLDEVAPQVGFILDDDVREAVVAATEHMALMGNALGSDSDSLPESRLTDLVGTAYAALTARVRAIYADRGQAIPPELP